jgi:hypothetical protein
LAASSFFRIAWYHYQRFQRIRFIRGDGDGRERFTRDRVAQGAAVEIDQTQIQLFSMACEEAPSSLLALPRPT